MCVRQLLALACLLVPGEAAKRQIKQRKAALKERARC